VLALHGVKLPDDTFSNLTSLESVVVSGVVREESFGGVPGKANFLADTRRSITTDLGGDGNEWHEVLG
jgi:hypothetical protein